MIRSAEMTHYLVSQGRRWLAASREMPEPKPTFGSWLYEKLQLAVQGDRDFCAFVIKANFGDPVDQNLPVGFATLIELALADWTYDPNYSRREVRTMMKRAILKKLRPSDDKLLSAEFVVVRTSEATSNATAGEAAGKTFPYQVLWLMESGRKLQAEEMIRRDRLDVNELDPKDFESKLQSGDGMTDKDTSHR